MLLLINRVANRRYLAFMRRLREENFPPSSDWSLRLRLLDVAERVAARVEDHFAPPRAPREPSESFDEAIARLRS